MADLLVLYDVDDKVSIISLNRPDKLNAVSNELLQRLTEAFERADADPATSVVLLRAEGRSFCAGHDIGAKGPSPRTPRRSRIPHISRTAWCQGMGCISSCLCCWA